MEEGCPCYTRKIIIVTFYDFFLLIIIIISIKQLPELIILCENDILVFIFACKFFSLTEDTNIINVIENNDS